MERPSNRLNPSERSRSLPPAPRRRHPPGPRRGACTPPTPGACSSGGPRWPRCRPSAPVQRACRLCQPRAVPSTATSNISTPWAPSPSPRLVIQMNTASAHAPPRGTSRRPRTSVVAAAGGADGSGSRAVGQQVDVTRPSVRGSCRSSIGRAEVLVSGNTSPTPSLPGKKSEVSYCSVRQAVEWSPSMQRSHRIVLAGLSQACRIEGSGARTLNRSVWVWVEAWTVG